MTYRFSGVSSISVTPFMYIDDLGIDLAPAFPFVPFLCKHFRKFFPCPDIRRFPVEISAQLPEEYVLYILEFMEFLFEKTTVMRPFESMFLTIDCKEMKCEMKVPPPPQPLPWARYLTLLWRVWEVARQNVAEEGLVRIYSSSPAPISMARHSGLLAHGASSRVNARKPSAMRSTMNFFPQCPQKA